MTDLPSRLATLVAGAEFQRLERLASRPNLFRALGRSFTETWHSAFLGWLLDPGGSHELGAFPLTRFLEVALTQRQASGPWPDGHDYLLSPAELAAVVCTFNASEADVWPSEEAAKEFNLPGFGDVQDAPATGRAQRRARTAGRPDVYVEISLEDALVRPRGTSRLLVLVEEKVGSNLHTGQEQRYPDYIRDNSTRKQAETGELVRGMCVYVAPSIDDTGRVEDLVGDPRWYVLSFQTLHDLVLAPCLAHEDLDADMRPLIDHYVRTLRLPVKGEKMAITEEERDIARAIFQRHKETLLLLAECLSASKDPEQRKVGDRLASAPGVRAPLVLVAGDGQQIVGNSVSQLYRAALAYADAAGKLKSAIIPYGKGGATYFINTAPQHASGKDFHNWTDYTTVDGAQLFVDTNFSRDAGPVEMSRFLKKLGLSVQVPGSG